MAVALIKEGDWSLLKRKVKKESSPC